MYKVGKELWYIFFKLRYNYLNFFYVCELGPRNAVWVYKVGEKLWNVILFICLFTINSSTEKKLIHLFTSISYLIFYLKIIFIQLFLSPFKHRPRDKYEVKKSSENIKFNNKCIVFFENKISEHNKLCYFDSCFSHV